MTPGAGDEVEVTEEMIQAGIFAFAAEGVSMDHADNADLRGLFTSIFRAMMACDPVVGEVEDLLLDKVDYSGGADPEYHRRLALQVVRLVRAKARRPRPPP